MFPTYPALVCGIRALWFNVDDDDGDDGDGHDDDNDDDCNH